MSAWETKFDDELERIGYRVRWEANRSYSVFAPGEKYFSSENSLANARTAAYNHWQASKKSTSTDCRTPEGITVSLIDSLITICRILVQQNFDDPAVKEALKDLASDEDFALIRRLADEA